MREREINNFINYQKSADNAEGERPPTLTEIVIKTFEDRGEDILMAKEIKGMEGVSVIIHSKPGGEPKLTIVDTSGSNLKYSELKELAQQLEE